MRSETEKKYLRATVQNASSAGIVIILLDLLIADLGRVIAAIAEGNIEKRATELKHAFLLLQQLEDCLDREKGGQAAQTFSAFYSAVRAKLLQAHIKISPEIFQRQIELLFEVRQAWQQIDKPNLGHDNLGHDNANAEPVASGKGTGRSKAAAAGGGTVGSMNWTA
jgi:flagellar secretion chaperone FliS